MGPEICPVRKAHPRRRRKVRVMGDVAVRFNDEQRPDIGQRCQSPEQVRPKARIVVCQGRIVLEVVNDALEAEVDRLDRPGRLFGNDMGQVLNRAFGVLPRHGVAAPQLECEQADYAKHEKRDRPGDTRP